MITISARDDTGELLFATIPESQAIEWATVMEESPMIVRWTMLSLESCKDAIAFRPSNNIPYDKFVERHSDVLNY